LYQTIKLTAKDFEKVRKFATPSPAVRCQATNAIRTRSAADMASEIQNIQNSSEALEQETRDFAAQGIYIVYQVEDEFFTYLDPEAVNNAADRAFPVLYQLHSGTTPLEAFARLHPAATSHFSDSESSSDTSSEPDEAITAATIDQLDPVSISDTSSEPDEEVNAATIDQLGPVSTSDTFSEPDQEVTAATIDHLDPVSTSATSTPPSQAVAPPTTTDQSE
jgi:hypothetical protein